MPMVSPRATSWVPPRNQSPGERAPSAVDATARMAAAVRRRRLPWESARATTPSATTMPRRTTASVTPWAVALRWNSSLAKVMVWVMTVPR